ncbi:hypothetical protein BDV27DRAFT_158663 [Aspergillus caelatus]|uniref:SGNH hydrolase-type esterase domain-containing protein n=1 Tax=Aspergillus caelatus TaxID=61420 RepID=A0A5N7A4X6_9EURO|nr:uncharacterized protein BDV27DRAFT_158663 [Aspergillus caelatus]KAE8363570.1 hypothetical protein BDV27DRAFT_158663 [Aspergillus caelatus]
MASLLQYALTWVLALTIMVLPLAAADGVPKLRIMPLGDSITKGNGSPDMNGYRSKLRERLVSSQKDSNFSVDMVGSLRDGGMQDNDHEGHSGKYLADIRQYLELSIDAKPNIVLVHAGTNNMDKEVDLDKADQLIESIIDRLFEGSRGVTVLIAPVIWANDPRMQKNTDAYNTKLRAIIKRRQQEGQHLLEVPISITASDLSDKKHPNSVGYGKMAAAWYDGILEAQTRGWIQTPAAVNAHDHPGMGLGDGAASPISGGNCGDNFKGKGKVFDGFRTWEAVGTIIGAMEGARRENVILADLNGDGHTDYILADDDGTVRAWVSTATSESPWMSLGNINPDWTDVSGAMVRMADVDNDGKADLIVLYSDGVAKVWKNVDNGRKFKSLDAKWATGLDQPREKVHFRDMDGDGYADYVILYEGGAVDWARNTHNNGQDDQKRNWEKAVAIAPGPAGEPDNRAQIFDLDGDNMADYLVIYEGGAVKAWRNTGSLNEKGHNWQSLGTIAPGIEGVTGNMIRFADMDGDGKADFLAIADDGSIRMWKSLGIVGGKGSSMRFADLDGDGHADIVSIDAQGRARGWLNKGGNKWDDLGEIAPGLDEDLSSSTIHFADVDGDKLDDFLVVYGGGAVKAYLNNGNIPDKGKDRIWQPSIIISEGVGDPGRKVEFADLNGDGYADYLIVFDGGAVDCWLNQKNIPPKGGERIWGGRTTVGTGVKEPGSKVHFADITGDRKAEYIIQYDGGSAKGYRNTGNIPDAGKDRNWVDLGTVSDRASTEGTVAYADINGDGKADYLVVLPSGEVHAYINSCSWTPPPPDKGDGDDGDGGDDGDNGSGGNGPDESHDGGQNWPSDDYEKCFVTDCDITCAPGLTILETFKTRCGEKSICCPPQRTPQNCTWTSGKPDEAKPVCIGSCDPGTVLLATNSDLCDTGNDAYCCESKQYQKVRDECHLGRDGCDNGYYQVAKENDQSSYYEVRPVCCKQQLKNCHWVKKNECTESNCEPYEFLLTTNPMGQWVYLCPAPYTMSLCCDAPDGIEPFLPVDLDNLFPDPPPVEDRVKWDLQILGGYEGTDGEMVDKNSSDDPNTRAFGFVLIAGPDDSLSSFSKRDGSDIELLDCESFKSGTEFQRTRLICINDGEDNNCDDILKGGLNGTVVRMPEGCGPGTYIVAHSLEESDNQTLPDHLVKRAPSTRKVMDLNFSYNFGLAKRAASVDDRLQIRVDYSNIPGYWNDIVDEEGEESSDKRRRGITPRISAHDISHKELHKRFFSDDSAPWGRKINKLVSAPYYTDLSYDFDSPMFYEKIDNCKGEQEKYLSMWAKGECKVGTKFGFTFIGTLDEFHLSQAYGFIDFKFDMETTIGVKGNAALNTKFRMKSAETKTKQEVGFSHPGLFDFKPQFDVDIGVQAEKATFAGDFTATIRTLTDDDDNDGWVSWGYARQYHYGEA